MKRDFLSINDWSTKELLEVLKISRQMKANPKKFSKALAGKSVALIFEKQSLRTHVTFEIGAKQMGANTTYLTNADISLGKRETIYDVAKNLERWVDAVVIRTYAQQNVVELAKLRFSCRHQCADGSRTSMSSSWRFHDHTGTS